MRKYKTLIIILLIILFTNCISVYATYTYFAKDISYTKKDGSTINVESALNELYLKKDKEIASIQPLQYPILTIAGMKNVQVLYKDGTISYDLNLDYDCTASDALDKVAYDNNPTTSYKATSSKKVFKFGENVDIYNVCLKTSYTNGKKPVRTLSRRVDGAYPSIINPKAIWEIKEYYYTTTFGSRVGDGVYETQLDGWELREVKESLGIYTAHYLITDDYFTWWEKGKSYLCRIIDSMHMGLLTEALFGKEVIERIPELVNIWIKDADKEKQPLDLFNSCN